MIPEPASPYLMQATASAGMPNPYGRPAQSEQTPNLSGRGSDASGQSSSPFGPGAAPFGSGPKTSGQGLNPFAFSSNLSGQGSNPFNSTAAPSVPFGQAAGEQQGSQPGRIQFGSKARNHPANRQPAQQHPFQKPGQPPGDPFGRQRPAQAMQPSQQSVMVVPAQDPSSQQQQQQMPGTPAPFASFNAVPSHQQPGFDGSAAAGFQTPTAQRPAFGGGVAASLQTPAAGVADCLSINKRWCMSQHICQSCKKPVCCHEVHCTLRCSCWCSNYKNAMLCHDMTVHWSVA